MNKIGVRLKNNGDICIFHTRKDLEQIMKYCNLLADKVDELVEKNNELCEKIYEMGVEL